MNRRRLGKSILTFVPVAGAIVSPAVDWNATHLSTSVLHILGVLIGELATMQAWLCRGLRLTGGVMAASGVAFLLHALGTL